MVTAAQTVRVTLMFTQAVTGFPFIEYLKTKYVYTRCVVIDY